MPWWPAVNCRPHTHSQLPAVSCVPLSAECCAAVRACLHVCLCVCLPSKLRDGGSLHGLSPGTGCSRGQSPPVPPRHAPAAAGRQQAKTGQSQAEVLPGCCTRRAARKLQLSGAVECQAHCDMHAKPHGVDNAHAFAGQRRGGKEQECAAGHIRH